MTIQDKVQQCQKKSREASSLREQDDAAMHLEQWEEALARWVAIRDELLDKGEFGQTGTGDRLKNLFRCAARPIPLRDDLHSHPCHCLP